jgi:hypothetical protein
MQETKQQQSSSFPSLLFLFPAATPSSIKLSPIDNKPHPPLSRTLSPKQISKLQSYLQLPMCGSSSSGHDHVSL